MTEIEEIRARHEAFPDDRSQAVSDRDILLRALDAMIEENAELTAVFVAQWGADMRAKQRWQIATGKEGTWPDRANLVVWLLERVEKLEAALDEAKWQPIETAPRDGTVVDLWMADQDGRTWREADAYWVSGCTDTRIVYASDGSYERKTCVRDGWYAPNHDYDGADGFADEPKHYNPHPRQQKWSWTLPTHWMPLPTPPATTQHEDTP